jgi:FkbM family methyltransferase
MGNPLELLARYVQPGDLVFDIGAHEGKHTAWMLDLGATVVAVEPQRALADRLLEAPPNQRLTVLNAAVSDHVGFAELYVSPDHSYVSTLDVGYLTQVQTHVAYSYVPPVEVPTVTLDSMIDTYGEPTFCKIDVEGHERAVFSGLSTPLKALSFEVHDFDLAKADDCLARLAQLGDYRYQFSSREDFVLQPWPAAVDIFGDIYCERL